MTWGRKFISGIGLIIMWTIMAIAGALGEGAYTTLTSVVVASLFATSVAGKFAK